ncbi:AbrB/MazE/SpoVT family DNA-binding domain-containing protein [candidate division KSB1 bacterium]|nr:AbrB/MazE/SpoVT family DNA-binding domain-containing protein [candidate division KSB1 bacterium]
MKTKIVQLGKSRGVRIPKNLLERSGLRDEVVLEVKYQQIIIRTASKPRAGWARSFRAMAKNGDDKLLDAEALPHQSSWDKTEWAW